MRRPAGRGRVLRRLLRSTAVAVTLATALAACDFEVYDLPLPGGPDVGEDPIVVTVRFTDVLDLVPHSTVKVNDVTVGRVSDVELEGWTAEVRLELREDVELPDNARAELRQTSLLGEKFVSLAPPTDEPAAGRLEDGDVIGLDRTGRNPEVEEVLGALSLVLNGGGVAQLQTITSELNRALEGRAGTTRSAVRRFGTLMEQLDAGKADIVAAIEGLNRLSRRVRKEQPTLDAALEELPSALRSIHRQRGDLVKMLRALDRLGEVGVDVVARSKDSTVETLRQLQPVLRQFADSGDDFANAFHVFLTYPFVDEAVGRDPQVARNLHMGDYTNLSLTLDIDLLQTGGGPPTLPTNLPTVLDPTAVVGGVLACLTSGDLAGAECRAVLRNVEQLLKLREECTKPENLSRDVCKQLNLVPGLPGLPSLPGLPALPSLPGLPDGAAHRAGPASSGRAARAGSAAGGTTRISVGELMELHDPTLVRLLVPGLVGDTRPGGDR